MIAPLAPEAPDGLSLCRQRPYLGGFLSAVPMLRLLVFFLAVSASGCASVRTPIQATTLAEVNEHLRTRSHDRVHTIEMENGDRVRGFNVTVSADETTWTPTSTAFPVRRMPTSEVLHILRPKLSGKSMKVMLPFVGIAVGGILTAVAVDDGCSPCSVGQGIGQGLAVLAGAGVGLIVGSAATAGVGSDYTVVYEAPLARYTDASPEAAPD